MGRCRFAPGVRGTPSRRFHHEGRAACTRNRQADGRSGTRVTADGVCARFELLGADERCRLLRLGHSVGHVRFLKTDAARR